MIINEYINHYQSEFWITSGLVILVIEVIFLGMLTGGVLLFTGLGALATGLLMSVGLLPETWPVGIAATGINSGVIAALLWKPLRRLQGERKPIRDKSSDLIGLEFVLKQDIELLTPGKTRYSGIDWRVEIAAEAGVKSISTDQKVVVASVDVGVFYVKPASTATHDSTLHPK